MSSYKHIPVREKWIDLSSVPLKEDGCYDWQESVGCKLPFVYGDISGTIEILECSKDKCHIKFKDKTQWIGYSQIISCGIKDFVGYHNSLYYVGDYIVDEEKGTDIVITNKVYTFHGGKSQVFYQYRCNKCGFDSGEHYYKRELKEEYYVSETSFRNHPVCACCQSSTSKIVVPKKNSIVATEPWMIPYFPDGEAQAEKYTRTCAQRIHPRCPQCGKLQNKEILVYNICNRKGITCEFCGDKKSLGEKIMSNVLNHFCGRDFITQFSCAHALWCGTYRYDFYFVFNDIQYIVEVHGGQHYNKSSGCWNSLEDTQANDKTKYELAVQNGIQPENYIVIDARESSLEYIKHSIEGSFLMQLFDLSELDWEQIGLLANESVVLQVCQDWKDGMLSRDICKKYDISNTVVTRYLKRGAEIGVVGYDSQQYLSDYRKSLARSFNIYRNGEFLMCYSGMKRLQDNSDEIFGSHLSTPSIRNYCLTGKEFLGGFTIEYADEMSAFEKQKELSGQLLQDCS